MSEDEIKLNIRSANDNKSVTVNANSSVKDLRKVVADAYSVTEPRVCLIYAGKILKDEETLEQHKIKDGLTLHLVIKSAQAVSSGSGAGSSAFSSPAAVSAPQNSGTPPSVPGATGTGGLGSGIGVGGAGAGNPMAALFGAGGLGEMQTRLQQEMMRNPQMLTQMMDNPMVQNLMSNPEVMRSLIEANPQMREVMERNPEVSQVFNNPSMMRQVMEIARNPAMMQEMMRNYDRALSNLEALPGGMGHLQRIYRDIQEPLMSATAEGVGGGNIFADLRNNPTGTTQQGVENTQPLPNPWQAATTGNNASTRPATAGTAPAATGAAPGLMAGLGNSPGMQSMMQQLSSNPQLMQRAFEAPYMQAMMDAMQRNPQLMESFMASNPMLASNPELRDQVREALPQLMSQPGLRNVMGNPRALQAMMQIQEGLRTLREEAPELLNAGVGLPLGPTAGPTTIPTAGTTPTTSATSTPSTGTTRPEPAGAPGGMPPQADMMNLLAGMMSMMGAAGGPGAEGGAAPSLQTSEQMYAAQLDQLSNMGFPDRAANLRALIATFGDVNAAIDRLLNQ